MKISDNLEKQAALDLTEDSREEEWKFESFVGELFKGNFRWDLIHPYRVQPEADKKIGDKVCSELEGVLKEYIDPDAVDKNEEVPESALNALKKHGYFGMKIPKEYGGMGLSVVNYTRAMALVGSYCGSTAVWLSAHQSIGVPQPLKMFGTKSQKEKYFPQLAKGAVSAFALTEPDVGSDPAKMTTTATPVDGGDNYLINGDKLYITNGPVADLLIVMAMTPSIIVDGKERKQITAFIVPTDDPGFDVIHECSFMGIRGIKNGWLRFTNVKVSKTDIIGPLGKGLKVALATLNTGRLTIPAISTASGKACMVMTKHWVNERVQWGNKIGNHQAVQIKLAKMAADTFAMESISDLTAVWADNENADIRLEAAMAKYFGSEVSCAIADETLQIRGGRGFETAESLRARGESPFPVERMVRDLRINRIIEGTSEIMQLFIAREAMDVHIKFIMGILSPKKGTSLLGAFWKAIKFYSIWYPKQWVRLPKLYNVNGLSRANRCHLTYISKTSKKLARALFHTMGKYQTKLEKEQMILAKFVDIGTDLFAMSASLAHAEYLLSQDNADKNIQNVVNLFCTQARHRIKSNFKLVSKKDRKLIQVVSQWLVDGDISERTQGIVQPEIVSQKNGPETSPKNG
ncbi:DNA polymerase II [bacterium]|nr:DNA polymerase II [bacterium]